MGEHIKHLYADTHTGHVHIHTYAHTHNTTISKVRWNKNGQWLLTGSRDRLIKIWDFRTFKSLQTFRGHKQEVTGCICTYICVYVCVYMSCMCVCVKVFYVLSHVTIFHNYNE